MRRRVAAIAEARGCYCGGERLPLRRREAAIAEARRCHCGGERLPLRRREAAGITSSLGEGLRDE